MACRRSTFAGENAVVLLGDFGHDGPSRPRQGPRPALWRGAGPVAKGLCGTSPLLLVTDEPAPAAPALGIACARACARVCVTHARVGPRYAHARDLPKRARTQARIAAAILSSVTRRSAGTKARYFASSPAPRTGDGRGHRRGLDGPPRPKPTFKNGDLYLSPPPTTPPAKDDGRV